MNITIDCNNITNCSAYCPLSVVDYCFLECDAKCEKCEIRFSCLTAKRQNTETVIVTAEELLLLVGSERLRPKYRKFRTKQFTLFVND